MRRRELSTILKEFERDMRNIFKDDFRMVRLYGSYARGDYNQNSDIDVMVLVNTPAVSYTHLDVYKRQQISCIYKEKKNKCYNINCVENVGKRCVQDEKCAFYIAATEKLSESEKHEIEMDIKLSLIHIWIIWRLFSCSKKQRYGALR